MTAAIITTPLSMPDLLGTSPADLMPTDAERYDSTPAEARERADRLRAGIVSYAQMRQDIADAYAGRDWIALGYDHWYAYVEAEFGEQLARLDRSERREAIGDLRAKGMSTRQIAKATGISKDTVHRAIQSGVSDETPATVTGSDGKRHPGSRPTPKPTQTPAPAATPSTAPAGAGSTSPAPEPVPAAEPERWTWTCWACKKPFEGIENACPKCGGFGTNRKPVNVAAELVAEIAADSTRRTAIRNLTSVLTFLSPVSIAPARLAEQEYGPVLDAFELADLERAAETMTAIVAMKRGM